MWFWALLGTLTFAASVRSQAFNPFRVHPGPKVIATRGEAWPHPYQTARHDGFLVLRPSVFQFLVTGQTCDIVENAIQRYTRIVITEAGAASRELGSAPRRHARLDPSFAGDIASLHVHLTNPCEHLPYLNMNESCCTRRTCTRFKAECPALRCTIFFSGTQDSIQRRIASYLRPILIVMTLSGAGVPALLENFSSDTLEILNTSETGRLVAHSVWGILRGLETFTHLLAPSGDGPNLALKCQTIVDKPCLPHRGLLLDTSRHYLPVSDILLTLDAMSYNKLNVFHWHIVDDNSFPYQSTRFPELSAKGSYHPSMIYTPDDVRRIIEHARLRGIRVVPEFDTPGHTRSWGQSYPALLTQCYNSAGEPDGTLGPIDPTEPTLYPFLRQLFAEIVATFPERYVHLGGDEVPFDCWASNPRIREYMRHHRMNNSYERLEEEYIQRLLNITWSLNATSIVWQEVFDNGVQLTPETVVHVWTGDQKSKLSIVTKAGFPALLSACWYLDHLANDGDWQKFYRCDPLAFPSTSEQQRLMMGGEACMWGESVDRTNVHPRIWPRASAAAERLWSHDRNPSITQAAQRLEEHTCRMNKRGIPAQPPNGPGFCIV